MNKWFIKQGREFPQSIFQQIYSYADGITWYVQDMLNRLYEQECEITELLLRQIFKDIVLESDVTYKGYCDILAKGQIKLLRAIAQEDTVLKPFEHNFMVRHRLTAVSSVKMALTALVQASVIYKGDDGYYLADRYFSMWLSEKAL